MAKKPAPKKAAKPAAKAASKKSAKPVKKTAPAKKPAAKKPAAKKVVKPVAKKSAKPAPKKATPKPVAKKPAPAPKKAPAKAAPKPIAKAPAKAAPKAPVKAVAPVKPVPVGKPVPAPKPVAAAPGSKAAATPSPKPSPAPKSSAKANAKKEKEDAKTNAAKPLVTQTSAPVIHKAAPMVKKHVSTLEAASKERYSDSELDEFRGIINAKLDEARKDYDLLKQTLANNDNNGTEDTSPSFKMIEDGSETLSREETAQLASRQEKFIKHLEDALLRIRNKTYGICRVTGRLISKERLRLVPHATLSIEAKQQMSS
jgi:RNA polymerase-binding transcription factor DksA